MCGGFMEDNVFGKLINKFKFHKNNKSYPSMDYAFSDDEIKNISKDNKEKISMLKKNDIIEEKNKNIKSDILDEVLSPVEGVTKIESNIDINNELVEQDDNIVDTDSNSFVNLSNENQNIIMKEWKNIDIDILHRDILYGKDLLNQSYNGSYVEDAMRYIHDIRKRYEVVISYLIGFNNEKKGIINKTFFSDNKEEEWKYLSNYIKVLDKIRSNK